MQRGTMDNFGNMEGTERGNLLGSGENFN